MQRISVWQMESSVVPLGSLPGSRQTPQLLCSSILSDRPSSSASICRTLVVSVSAVAAAVSAVAAAVLGRNS